MLNPTGLETNLDSRPSYFFLLLFLTILIHACAPARPPRSPIAEVYSPLFSERPTVAPKAEPETELPPALLEQSRIREEELAPQPQVKEQGAPPAPEQEKFPVMQEKLPAMQERSTIPEGSLIAKITPETPPQRAISLRLAEEGKRLLDAGDTAKALARLEKSITIDSTNAYGYYYLAQAHHQVGRYKESLNFLEVAESLLAGDHYWLAEVYALKGENFRLAGFLQQADSSYTEALRLNPANRLAADGLSRMRENSPAVR